MNAHIRHHQKYIQRTFDLAEIPKNKVGRNPNVGSVLVYQNRIIGEGYYSHFGAPHAEEIAIRNAIKQGHEQLISKATLYVSLEPCNFTGKRPPCSDLILKHQIKNLVVSCEDPNPKISGSSLEHLRQQGIQIEQNVLMEQGENVIRFFKTNTIDQRPYVYLKYAQDHAGYMAKKGAQVWITGPSSQMATHKLRSEVDAILVGVNTVIVDDPQLTCRAYEGPNPMRVVIDPNDRIPTNAKLLADNVETLIFSNKNEHINLTTRKVQLKGEPEELCSSILSYLFEQDINRIMVEGGPKTLNEFIKDDLWDEAMIHTSKNKLNLDVKAPNLVGKLLKKYAANDDHIMHILNKN